MLCFSSLLLYSYVTCGTVSVERCVVLAYPSVYDNVVEVVFFIFFILKIFI